MFAMQVCIHYRILLVTGLLSSSVIIKVTIRRKLKDTILGYRQAQLTELDPRGGLRNHVRVDYSEGQKSCAAGKQRLMAQRRHLVQLNSLGPQDMRIAYRLFSRTTRGCCEKK